MFDPFSSVASIHKMYRERSITVKEVVMEFLSRIARYDSGENGLRSVIEINPDILFLAEDCDRKLKEQAELLPLFGIPILLKDNINTKDKMRTSAGSIALSDNYAPYASFVARKLKAAGAIFLGKANMTEFANYMTREGMPNGYSSRGGRVLNPYNREGDPGGSSSGSGVSVAAGLCVMAIGTETSGSIISPSARNGIVGIKPTLGLVSRSGILPIASTHDTAGPMARTVEDAAVLLSAIAGQDENDIATLVHAHNQPYDYTAFLRGKDLKGVRVGINRPQSTEEFKVPEKSDAARAAFDALCTALQNAGAELVDTYNTKYFYEIRKILHYEFKTCLNYYLSTVKSGTNVKTLSDIVAYNQTHKEVALRYGQSLLIESENKSSGALTEPAYIESLKLREATIRELEKIFNDNRIDVLLSDCFTNIAPFTGFPSMTVPIGQDKESNMPLDSYWIARRFDEGSLIRVCHAVEQIYDLKLRPEL